MWLFLILACSLCCCGFELKKNETGRFVYQGHNGDHLYCTKCNTGSNDIENKKTQQPECIQKNFKVSMPDNSSTIPMCKEHVPDAVIPGCGPLPRTGGLSWVTGSGRAVKKNSTVYEEYFPRCPQGGVLNSDIESIRCWETLRWDVKPEGLQCIIIDQGYCSEKRCIIIGLCSLAALLIVILVCISLYIYRSSLKKSCSESTSPGEKEPMICSTVSQNEVTENEKTNEATEKNSNVTGNGEKEPTENSEKKEATENENRNDANENENEASKMDKQPTEYIDKVIATPSNIESKSHPWFHSINPSDNIRVFQTLRTNVTRNGLFEFVVQKGEAIFIATRESMRGSECLQIGRIGGSYRGRKIHPFMHYIDNVETQDSGLYIWGKSSAPAAEYDHKFYLTVDDRGQPDGGDSLTSQRHVTSCSYSDVQTNHLEYHSSVSFPCLGTDSFCLTRTDCYHSCMEWRQRADPHNSPVPFYPDVPRDHCSVCARMHQTRPKVTQCNTRLFP